MTKGTKKALITNAINLTAIALAWMLFKDTMTDFTRGFNTAAIVFIVLTAAINIFLYERDAWLARKEAHRVFMERLTKAIAQQIDEEEPISEEEKIKRVKEDYKKNYKNNY